MYKKCQVVMLTANEKAIKVGDLFIDIPLYDKGKLHLERCEKITQHGHSWSGSGIKTDIQHLYILSDDKVEEGIWCYDLAGKIIYCQEIAEGFASIGSGMACPVEQLIKVIATTDSSLNLPQPSQSFVEKYVEQYNKGNVIKEVMVEYEELVESATSESSSTLEPKVRDNTITIKKLKDSWSREEVESTLLEIANWLVPSTILDIPKYNKWIKENL